MIKTLMSVLASAILFVNAAHAQQTNSVGSLTNLTITGNSLSTANITNGQTGTAAGAQWQATNSTGDTVGLISYASGNTTTNPVGGTTSRWQAVLSNNNLLLQSAGSQVMSADGTNVNILNASGGGVSLPHLTTGTNADFVCYAAGGALLIQSTACTISSLRFKPDWKNWGGNALKMISALDVGTFHIDGGEQNADHNAANLQVGLNAENVAKTIPEAAIYEPDGVTPKSYRQESVIAVLARAIQEQQAELDWQTAYRHADPADAPKQRIH